MQIYRCFPVLFLALAFATAGRAQVVTPNPAPTIITTAPYTISKAGFYQLGANLTYTGNGAIPNDAIITVAASNVTLDFGGHYISGPSTNAATGLYGVYAYERGNLNIQNGTITDCLDGVELAGNGKSTSLNINQRVSNLLVSHCYFIGIDLNEVANSQVNDCRVSFIGGTTYSTFTGSAVGIAFDPPLGQGCQANRNTVNNITAGANNGFGIYCNGADASGNRIDTVTSGDDSVGLSGAGLAAGNLVSNSYIGIGEAVKYQNNLTLDCTTPYRNGTNAGNND